MTERPKVLHVSTAKSWRGGEQQIAYLLQELEKMRVPQAVLATAEGPFSDWCRQQGFNLQAVKKGSSFDLSFARKLARYAATESCELIHVHDSHAHTFAVLAQQFYGCKLPIVVSRRVDFPIGTNLLSRFKYNHPAVKRIICVSQAIAEIVKREVKNKELVKVVHSGVDPQKFKRIEPGKLRAEYGLSADAKLIGNVAALADHKDYFTFIDTAQLLQQNNPDRHFFIIGDGELSAELEAYGAKKKIKNLHFTGFRKDVAELLPDLDLFLFPSKMEGLGTSILDALAAKVPVVACRAGGIPEIIQHQKNGLLCEVGQARCLSEQVEIILKDKNLRKSLIEAGEQSLINFNPHQVAKKTLEQYREVVS
jgi:glycosyltransferase involved in cell wall biosynthesis